MKFARGVRLGAWLLVALNVVLAFTAIWVLLRIPPAVTPVLDLTSLAACEEMLVCLGAAKSPQSAADRARFEQALNTVAVRNGKEAVRDIVQQYKQAFAGNEINIQKTRAAIRNLSAKQRQGLVSAGRQVRQFASAGAWVVVFMAQAIFLIGLLFLRKQKSQLLAPLEEVIAVLQARKNGDSLRRCGSCFAPLDMQFLFGGINELLDRTSALENSK